MIIFIFSGDDIEFFLLFFQIRPFREAHKNRQKDKELLKLAKYLKRIAALDDFSSLNHKYWERFVLLQHL